MTITFHHINNKITVPYVRLMPPYSSYSLFATKHLAGRG